MAVLITVAAGDNQLILLLFQGCKSEGNSFRILVQLPECLSSNERLDDYENAKGRKASGNERKIYLIKKKNYGVVI